jgi:GGDEF domain-containing protein
LKNSKYYFEDRVTDMEERRGGMGNLETEFPKGTEAAFGRVLNRDSFFFLLDLEIKRARRYQNFICLLLLRLKPFPKNDHGPDFQDCCKALSNLLMEEMRDSDILGILGEHELAILLPYADVFAGDHAKCRFEGALKCFDPKSKGYEVMIDQVCFPGNGTNSLELIKNALEKESY